MQKVLSLSGKIVKSRWSIILLISSFYLVVNILFNFHIWKQVVLPEPANVFLIQGESPIYEYIAETVHQNILAGKNPFTPTQNILYPFGLNFAIDDLAPINGFYFVVLRLFLSVHQSLMLIVVLNIFLANVLMYLFLRMIGINFSSAFLFGLVYGFTPFISLRIGGHPSYTAIYLFPLLSLFALAILQCKSKIWKSLAAILLGITLIVTLLTNLYFAVMVFLLCLFLSLFYFFFRKQFLFRLVKEQAKYLAISVVTAVILSLPWLTKAYEIIIFRQYKAPPSWVDSVAFSADLFGIFLPSYLNPFYGPFLNFLSVKIPYVASVFENFIYPGIIILATYLFLIFFRKKLPPSIVKKIVPFFAISLAFWVLTLGPFLHIWGKVFNLPLPYAVLNLTPYLQMARAPGRFIIPFVFLACITAAIIFSHFLGRMNKLYQNLLLLGLILIFFLDQSYFSPPPIQKVIPTKIYANLASQNPSPILEIPFTIRDGLNNLGDIFAVWQPRAQLIHQQPIFGAYFGRIDEATFSHYKNNPLFGPLGKLVSVRVTDLASDLNFDLGKMAESLEFFGIENVLLKENEGYSEIARAVIEDLEFETITHDGEYTLYQKTPTRKEFGLVQLGSGNDDLFLEQGWSVREESGRWVVGKVSNALFKLNEVRPLRLQFSAKTSAEPQEVTVYVNNHEIGKVLLGTNLRSYTVFADWQLRTGVNIVTFRFSKTVQLARILPQNQDLRHLAAFFTEIKFEETATKLFSKKPAEEFTKIDFSSKDSDLFLVQGWSDLENGARWTEGKTAIVIFKINKVRPMKLLITAEAIYKPQKIQVFVNDKRVGQLTVKTGKSKNYALNLGASLRQGINIVTFKFSHTQQLSKINPSSTDTRNLSLYLKSLSLEDLK